MGMLASFVLIAVGIYQPAIARVWPPNFLQLCSSNEVI